MRTSIAALALIRLLKPRAWLAQWNEHWEALSFIGGHVHEGESFRECCEREVAEELGLHAGDDFEVGAAALGHIEFDAWSRSAGVETHYVFEVFDVLLKDHAFELVARNSANCWLGADQIRAGQSADGRAVSPTVLRVLIALNELLG